MKRMIEFRLIILFFTLVALPAALRADDDVEHFLLPETPPSIERMKKAPLDKPELRKQNFDASNDISLPPALLDLRFPVFSEETFPVRIGVSRGSFAGMTGDLFVASPYGWQAGFRTSSTDGEKANLSREEHLFRWDIDTFAAPGTRVTGNVAAAESAVWRQQHRYYGLKAGGDWHSDASSLNIKTNVSWERGEVKGDAENDHVAGAVTANYSLTDGHNVSLLFAPEQDTAFSRGHDFITAGARYSFSPAPDLAVAGGCRFQDSRWYPQAEAAWHAFRLCRLSVSYEPGIEKPSWANLYMSDKYVQTASSLAFPEKVFSLREKLSFYRGDNDLFEIAFQQASWRNYLYWRQAAGTDYITPDNLNAQYAAGMELTARHKGERFSPALSVQYNSNDNIPFVPAYTLKAGLDYAAGTWTFSGIGTCVGSRAFSFSDAHRLAAYTDLGAGVRKKIVPGIEVSLAGTNLLSRTIELQPGFVRKAPDVQAGITVSF